jgi:hypothetical protein
MSVASHYAAGYALGLVWRFAPTFWRVAQADRLDRWGYDREWKQNLAGQNPNDPMSTHQLAEAFAWGNGFRRASGLPPVSRPG